jgi:hypothetical protein
MTTFPQTPIDFRVVAPKSTGGEQVSSSGFGESAAITAAITHDNSGGLFSVAAIASSRVVTTTVWTTGDLPGKPKKVTTTELVPVAKSDGKTPLAVTAGEVVTVSVGFNAPAQPANTAYTATLSITIAPAQGGAATTEAIAMTAIAATVSLNFPAMSITQTRLVDVPLSISLSGPPTSVVLSANPPSYQGITLNILSAGAPNKATLHMAAGWDAVPGKYPLGFYATAYAGWQWWFPSTLTVNQLVLQPSPIDATYAQFAALLGAPTGPEAFCADNIGQYRPYQNGVIYWSGVAGTGAFELDGPILDAIRQFAANQPQLLEDLAVVPTYGWGYPTSNVTPVFPAGRAAGMFSTFQNGSVYWGPNTGACGLFNGSINDVWGGPSSEFGFPIADDIGGYHDTTTPPYNAQDFENNVIYQVTSAPTPAKAATWTFDGQTPNAFHAQKLLDAVSAAIDNIVKKYNSATPPPSNPIGMKGGPYFPGAPVTDYSIQQNDNITYVQNRRYHVAQDMFADSNNICAHDCYFTISFDLELTLGGPASIGTPGTDGNPITSATTNSLLALLSNGQCNITSPPSEMTDDQKQFLLQTAVTTLNDTAQVQVAIPNELASYLGVKTLMNGDFAVLIANPF